MKPIEFNTPEDATRFCDNNGFIYVGNAKSSYYYNRQTGKFAYVDGCKLYVDDKLMDDTYKPKNIDKKIKMTNYKPLQMNHFD